MDFALLVFSASSAFVALITAFVAIVNSRRSLPKRVIETVNAFGEQVESMRTRSAQQKLELEAVLEDVENVCSSIERKRRSLAASASKISEQGEPAEPDPETRLQLEQRARQQGLIALR